MLETLHKNRKSLKHSADLAAFVKGEPTLQVNDLHQSWSAE